MHLVFISSLVPAAAPASGYDIANRVIADAARRLGHKVSVLGFLQPGHQPAHPEETRLLGTLEVTNARVGKLQKALWPARMPLSMANLCRWPRCMPSHRPGSGLRWPSSNP